VKIGAKRIRKHQDRFVLVTLNENVEDLASDGNFVMRRPSCASEHAANQTKCDHESFMMTQSWSKVRAPGNSPSRAVAQINKLFAKRTELLKAAGTTPAVPAFSHRPTCPVSNHIETGRNTGKIFIPAHGLRKRKRNSVLI